MATLRWRPDDWKMIIQASSLLTHTLADLVARQEEYEQAQQRSLTMLKIGFDLGTQGNIPWKREELHVR